MGVLLGDLVAVLGQNRLVGFLGPLGPRPVLGRFGGQILLTKALQDQLPRLGLGGLAFALAAKDMVQNLFGSITVLLDRTFTVGDWIKVDDQEGSVEALGFRSTRIRTFYNSLVTVPNSKFITATVDNMGARRFRRRGSHPRRKQHPPA